MRERPMKMILAFIPIYRLDRVSRELIHIEGFPGMTVVHGQGFGQEKMERALSIREEVTDFTPNVQIEMVVPNRLVGPVIEAVLESAYTGDRGNGKIFVLPVEHAVRIKTKQGGEMAV
jgi:nitrogen regulatory protein P-II 1